METQGQWVAPAREKRREEQRQKSPFVPTFTRPFPKLKANADSWLGTTMFSICVPKPRTAYYSEFFSCVRTRRLLSRHTCPVRSPRLCVQGKLSYLLIFPNKKRRNYRWLGKTFRMLSAGTFQFAPWNFRRAFSLDPTDCRCVSEDDEEEDIKKELRRLLQDRIFSACYPSSFLTPHDTANLEWRY